MLIKNWNFVKTFLIMTLLKGESKKSQVIKAQVCTISLKNFITFLKVSQLLFLLKSMLLLRDFPEFLNQKWKL